MSSMQWNPVYGFRLRRVPNAGSLDQQATELMCTGGCILWVFFFFFFFFLLSFFLLRPPAPHYQKKANNAI